MTMTSWGYNGTIDETQWARMSEFFGTRHAVRGAGDWAMTGVANERQVSVAPGLGYGHGVTDLSDAPVVLPIPAPTESVGRFHLIVARRNWSNNDTSFALIAGPGTDGTTPTLPPASLPAELNEGPGTLDDQPLGWAWVKTSSTNVVLFDLRTFPIGDTIELIPDQVAAALAAVNIPGQVSNYFQESPAVLAAAVDALTSEALAARDAAAAAAAAAAASAAEIEQLVIDDLGTTDAQSAALLTADSSLTSAAADERIARAAGRGGVLEQEFAAVGELVHGGHTTAGPVAARNAAASFPGSLHSGNVFALPSSRRIATGGYNAFPGIALCRDGSMIVCFRKGGTHVDKGAMYQSRSSDLGNTWSTPVLIVDDPVLDIRDVMLSTLRDGRIAMYYFVYNGTYAIGSYVRFSTDNGETWGAAIHVPFTAVYGQAATGPVVELANGDLLVACYTYDEVPYVNTAIKTMRSADGGETWGDQRTPFTSSTSALQFMEPVMGFVPDGRLMMLLRISNAGAPETRKAYSSDGGLTWSAHTLVLAASSGRPSWLTLDSGAIVFNYRRTTGSDWKHEFVTSWDNGATWSAPSRLHLAPSTQSVYVQMVAVAAGLIGTVYADETTTTVATVDFKYLVDGYGVTPLGDQRLRALDRVTLGQAALTPNPGSAPALSAWPGVGSHPLTYIYTPTGNLGVVATIPAPPADWNTYDVVIWWTTEGAGTGNVMFQLLGYPMVAGLKPNTQFANSIIRPTATAIAPGDAVASTIAAGLPRIDGPLMLRLLRVGADATDTYTGNIHVAALELVRTS